MSPSRLVPPPVGVSVTVPAVIYETLEQRARALKVSPEAFVQRILNAGLEMVRAIGARSPLELPDAPAPVPVPSTVDFVVLARAAEDSLLAMTEAEAARDYTAAEARYVEALAAVGCGIDEIEAESGLAAATVRRILAAARDDGEVAP